MSAVSLVKETIQNDVFKDDISPYLSENCLSSAYIQDGVEGCGAFSARAFKAGDIVLPLTGLRLHTNAVKQLGYDVPLLQIDNDWYLLAMGRADDYINHSCTPNLGFSGDGKNFIALRNIKPGEELFFDYAMSESDTNWKIKCLCGMPQCRSVVTGFSATDSVTQKRILPYALPYIRNKAGYTV